MRNEKISIPYLQSRLDNNTYNNVSNKSILVLSDTTEYNLNCHKNRIDLSTGIGKIGNNLSLGFFQHAKLALDRETKTECLGWLDNKFYTRSINHQSRKRNHKSLPIQAKESNKWLEDIKPDEESVFEYASNVLYVMDREADIYQVLYSLSQPSNAEVLVRVQHNRLIKTNNGETTKVFDQLRTEPVKTVVNLQIDGENKKRKKRKAICELKFASYNLIRTGQVKDKHNYPEQLKMQVVQIRERQETIPKGEQAISWTLWTSQEVENIDDALEILKCYKARWYIEEGFRLLKTKGFNIESSELESAESIKKLLLMAMEASIKIMQLKAARDGKVELKIEDYFSNNEILLLQKLNEKLEGNTKQQKNPFPTKSLSYASWIIARLGGWKGYASQRPPGTITFKNGLEVFDKTFIGFSLKLE